MASAPKLPDGGEVTLDDAVFAAAWNATLVHESVRAELGARRRGTASTKTRGRVRGGGAKPWRQKGTGRARAGSSRSPIWTGGGTVFGPQPRHYVAKVNKKARRAALRSVLSVHAERGSLAILDGAAFDAPSTKRAAEALAGWSGPRPLLVLVEPGDEVAGRSVRNLQRVTVKPAHQAGVADILGAAGLLLTQAALDHLTARASGRRAAAEQPA